ncbi:hypothetical protein PSPO01_05508 [Paraphaeosphaeria sporulosa]
MCPSEGVGHGAGGVKLAPCENNELAAQFRQRFSICVYFDGEIPRHNARVAILDLSRAVDDSVAEHTQPLARDVAAYPMPIDGRKPSVSQGRTILQASILAMARMADVELQY